MNDLISIIVPIYKVEKYLHKCVDSIINQTYQNLEIILVDDGSPDKCGEICDEYAKNDSRIKVIHKENGGLSDARNAGMAVAKGEYVAFIDSDDYIVPGMIETLYNRICEDKSDLALCNFMYVYEEFSEIKKKENSPPIRNEIISGQKALMKLVESKNWYYVVAVNKIYRKELFDNVRFPKGKQHEDEFVIHRIFGNCNKISCVAEPLYFYVQRSSSIMNSSYSVKRMDAVEAYLDRICFFLDKDMKQMAEKTAYAILTIFRRASENLDLKDEKNKNRYYQLLRQFKKVYHNKLMKKVSLRANLHFSVFCVSSRLYNLLQKTHNIVYKARKIGIRGCIIRVLMKPKQKLGKLARAYIFNNKFTNKVKNLRKRYNKIVFIVATPCHGNLGDHAIVYAEHEILKKFGYTENIVEISNNEYKNYKRTIRKYICEDDIIIIDGGGNLGTLWPHEDDKISEIIEDYSSNAIVVFPQTCFYDDSREASERLRKNKEIYSKADNLTIALRDRKSYDFCMKNFTSTKFVLVPDIVLSLKKCKKNKRDDKCLLCFREDLEKVLEEQDKNDIVRVLRINNINTEKVSTICHNNVVGDEREFVLEEIWDCFSSAKLLLTDRLHGMIFAAITSTPCLALDNKSKKVSGVYEWISNLEYVHMCNSVEEMIQLIPKYYNMEYHEFDNSKLMQEFHQLMSALNGRKEM